MAFQLLIYTNSFNTLETYYPDCKLLRFTIVIFDAIGLITIFVKSLFLVISWLSKSVYEVAIMDLSGISYAP